MGTFATILYEFRLKNHGQLDRGVALFEQNVTRENDQIVPDWIKKE